MKDVRIPGVVWAIAIIVAVAAIHENEAYLLMRFGLEPFYLDLLVGLLIAALKTLSLGTEQLNQALDVIERLLARRPHPPEEGMRGVETVETMEVVAEIPPRPNKLVRWLVG
jgi:hypothetical protein